MIEILDTPELRKRFYASFLPLSSGCWEWIGSKSPRGYAEIYAFNKNRRMVKASRASWVIHNGTIPPGLYLLHKCDNPGCVNPDHLFLGTHQDNQADKVGKNRQAKGSKHGQSKLTDAAVIEIYRRYAAGGIAQQTLAGEFMVSDVVISTIVTGKGWGHLTGGVSLTKNRPYTRYGKGK